MHWEVCFATFLQINSTEAIFKDNSSNLTTKEEREFHLPSCHEDSGGSAPLEAHCLISSARRSAMWETCGSRTHSDSITRVKMH